MRLSAIFSTICLALSVSVFAAPLESSNLLLARADDTCKPDLVEQKPEGLRCGENGVIQVPFFLWSSKGSFEECRDACLNDHQCHSFSYDDNELRKGVCHSFIRPVNDGMFNTWDRAAAFYDRGCFNDCSPEATAARSAENSASRGRNWWPFNS